MISEHQAQILLKRCEERLGKRFDDLRQKLREQRDTKAWLWELILLTTASDVATCEYEMGEAMPDVYFCPKNCKPLWLEAAYITPQGVSDEKILKDFCEWIRKNISASPSDDNNLPIIRLEPIACEVKFTPPDRDSWSGLPYNESWRKFRKEWADGERQIRWIPDCGNVRVEIQGVTNDGIFSTSWPVPNLPNHPSFHPVYKAIRKKAEQAKNWVERGHGYNPLVVYIAVSEGLSHVDPMSPNAVSLRNAVYSALIDPRKCSPLEMINSAGSWPSRRRNHKIDPTRPLPRNWSLTGPSLRVSGSRLISGVVVVKYEHQFSLYGQRRGKAASVEAFRNPHSDYPLSEDQESALTHLDFNKINYGPGWEAWHSVVGKGKPRTKERLRRRGGKIVHRHLANGAFSIEIPSVLLTRILGGDCTVQSAFDGYSSDIMSLTKKALDQGQIIDHVEYLAESASDREESRIQITYSAPFAAILNKHNSEQ